MNETEFIDALDRWGPDIDTWPSTAADGARVLLQQSAVARQRHAEAVAIARLVLESLPANSFDVARVRSSVLRRIAEPASRFEAVIAWLVRGSGWARAWRPAAVALVPLMLGLSLGIAAPDPDASDAAMEEAVSLFALQDATYEEYGDAQ